MGPNPFSLEARTKYKKAAELKKTSQLWQSWEECGLAFLICENNKGVTAVHKGREAGASKLSDFYHKSWACEWMGNASYHV